MGNPTKPPTESTLTEILRLGLVLIVVVFALAAYLNSIALLRKLDTTSEPLPNDPKQLLTSFDVEAGDVQNAVDNKRADLKELHSGLNWFKWYGTVFNEHLRTLFFDHIQNPTPNTQIQYDIFTEAKKDPRIPISSYPNNQSIVNRFARLPNGVLNMRLKHQLNFLKSTYTSFYNEYLNLFSNSCQHSKVLSCEDSFLLYSHLRETKPRVIIVIASNYSDYAIKIMIAATESNMKENKKKTKILVISQGHDIEERPEISIVSLPLLDIPLNTFAKLYPDDFLYIEGPMVTKIYGSLIMQLVFILPRLNKGVYVHFSGIYLPQDYPELFMRSLEKQYTHQWLLAVFLYDNKFWEIHLANHFLFQQDEAKSLDILSYKTKWTFTTSFYIHKV